MPTAAAHSLPGLSGTCTVPAPCTSRSTAPASPDKAPKGLPGKERFYSWLPQDCLSPAWERGPRPGHWQSVVVREDAPPLAEPYVPPGSAHGWVSGPSTVLPSPKDEPWPQPPQLPGVLLFIHRHRRFPGHPLVRPGCLHHHGCPVDLHVPAAHQGHVSLSIAQPPSEP